jgi:chemotaxis response regulator CheB
LGATRVAFVDSPRFFRELVVEMLDKRTAFELCDHELDSRDLVRSIAASRVDVLIAGPSVSDPDEVCRLLESFPRLKALVVFDSGRRATFYELRPSRELGELSADLLVATVEQARRRCADRFEDVPSGVADRGPVVTGDVE